MQQFGSFYHSVSATSENNKCHGEINEMIFKGDENWEFIPEENKKIGDPFYSYFSEKSSHERHQKI